jgi:hypothetical protein
MTAMKQRAEKRNTTLVEQISHCCSTNKHPHWIFIQEVEGQLPLLKRHTAPVHPMSPRNKESRMNQINWQYYRKQAHSGHWHRALGRAKCRTIHGLPQERSVKCHISVTAPVHVAFSCFSPKLSFCWWYRPTDSITSRRTWQWALSSTRRDWTWNACLLGNNDTNKALHMTPRDRLLGNDGPVLQQHDETRQIPTHYTSQRTEMKLTGQMRIITNYGKHETCLQF